MVGNRTLVRNGVRTDDDDAVENFDNPAPSPPTGLPGRFADYISETGVFPSKWLEILSYD